MGVVKTSQLLVGDLFIHQGKLYEVELNSSTGELTCYTVTGECVVFDKNIEVILCTKSN